MDDSPGLRKTSADVDVTFPDGSKKIVRGTWRLETPGGSPIVNWPAVPANWHLPGCATGTGIEVQFGKYRLLVRYPREASLSRRPRPTIST